MQTVPLCELGKIVSGSTPKTDVPQFWNGDIPWITPADLSNHDGIYFHGTPRRISRAGFESCSTAMLPAGSILFSSRAPIGHCALTAYPACTNQGFKSIVPNDRLDPVYGYFALKFITPTIVALGRGATFAEINKAVFESVPVPYCDLSEQRRIAGRLEQADRLRRTRRYALELTDTFLPAAFLQLFGDPVQNPKGWPVVAVEEAGSVQLGRQRAPKYQTGRFRTPYIRVANVFENQIDLSDLLYMDFDEFDCATYALEYGDILLNEGQSTELVGRAAMWRDEIRGCCFQNTLLRFQADGKMCEPAYALWLFLRYLHAGEFAKLSAKTSSVAHLGSYRLSQMRFPLPPLPLQRKFAALVERVAHLRAVQREAVRQAEHLFASLLDRAFSG